jgi:hypothetical protein
MNDDKNIKEYFKKWKGFKLSEDSRARMERELLEYTQFHGTEDAVRVSDESRSIGQVPQRTSFISRLVTIRSRHMTAALVAVALIAGGGTTYAAQGAVPGDILYPVKVEINENVRSAIAVSNESEAELQAVLVRERLEEAETLAARGELDAEASANLRTRLAEHYTEASDRGEAAQAEGDFETSAAVRASLEGTLKTYDGILTRLNADISGNDGMPLIFDVREYGNTTAEAQATATTEVNVEMKTDVEAVIARVESQITALTSKLDRAEAKLSAETYTRFETHLNEAVRLQAQASTQLRSGFYREAYGYAQAALQIVEEVEVALSSVLRLEVDVDLPLDLIDSNTRTDIQMESGSGRETDADDDGNPTEEPDETQRGIDIELDAETDASIDIELIDTSVRGDASVSTDAALGF